MNLKKIFGNHDWKPREGLVYKSWTKGDSHFGKSATVKIFYEVDNFYRGYLKQNNNWYQGTFRVKNGQCEIRLKNDQKTFKLTTSIDNVSFKKKIEHINTIAKYGQNGYAGTEIQYTAKIINPQITQVEQVTDGKN